MKTFRDGFAAIWDHVPRRVKVFVIGERGLVIQQKLQYIEPMLFSPPEAKDLTPVELLFTRCNDIYAHLPTLYRTVVDRQYGRILELGTRTGESTLALLMAAQATKGNVTSVDIQPVPVAWARIEEAGLLGLWEFIHSDDLLLEWNDHIDLLFIDTTHQYEHTLRELAKYEPFVVEGGAIALHDTTFHPEIWKATKNCFGDRSAVRIFRYFHNNGLTLIDKLPDDRLNY